jgi:hypothetical protein
VPVVKFAAAARGAKKKEVVARAVFPNLKEKVAAVEAGSSVDEDEGEEDEDEYDDEDDGGGQQGESKSKRVRREEGEVEE